MSEFVIIAFGGCNQGVARLGETPGFALEVTSLSPGPNYTGDSIVLVCRNYLQANFFFVCVMLGVHF